jgi:phospholipid/cholesterol/gamma-HCH transport system permease protein
VSAGRRLLRAVALAGVTPWRLDGRLLLERLDEVLWGSLFLTTVTVTCVGAAMCDQAAAQAMRLLGDQSFIGPEYIVLGFEEFGPLIVALTLAARVGAGFAAEVATLSSEQTLDMLELFGADPVRDRLAPMGVACVVGGACLGLISAVTWELAGVLTMSLRHGISPFTFVHPEAVGLHSLVLCVLKNALMGGLVFVGALIAGLRARGDAEAVGDATTRAGVYSLVLVLSCNLVVDVVWFASKGAT